MWFVRSGSRVTGPYNESQLRALRERGEFSPVHLVSTDKIRWESAGSLIQMLDGPAYSEPVRGTYAAGNSGKTKLTGTAPQPQWYYADQNRNTQGPVNEGVLRDLLRNGQLPRATSVCREGSTTWEVAKDVPAFAGVLPGGGAGRWLKFGAMGVGGVTALTLVFYLAFTLLSYEDDGEAGQGSSADNKPGNKLIISTLDDEDRLAQAVGLVVMCERKRFPSGVVLDEPGKSGTCFACTEDGYLLTNKHVVDTYSPKAPGTFKFKDGTEVKVEVETTPFVYFDGVQFPSQVIHISPRYDLAILKVNRKEKQPFFRLSRQTSFKRIQVAAIGFPGVANRTDPERGAVVRARVSSALQDLENTKNLPLDTFMDKGDFDYTQTIGNIRRISEDSRGFLSISHGAAISNGNSGGPLVDMECRVLGINTIVLTDALSNVFVAYSSSQFQAELREHIPSEIIWTD